MVTARLRPQMMRLTDAAANRIKSVMANAGRPIVGVRVGSARVCCRLSLEWFRGPAEEAARRALLASDLGTPVQQAKPLQR